jgi:putative membrane protein
MGAVEAALGAGGILAALLYLGAAVRQGVRGRPWRAHRSALWVAGIAVAGAGFAGPLADRARTDFSAHMGAHLLLGMAAPILLVLARPLTLVLRSIGVRQARRLSRLLKSVPVRFIAHPVTAAAVNTGSLWVLYSTPAADIIIAGSGGHLVVSVHFLLTGYLFTAAIIGRDPNPHRAGLPLRAGVLILAMAAHSILAKAIYRSAPAGVSPDQAEAGGYLMYYGGTLADAALVTVFCAQWYALRDPLRPRSSVSLRHTTPAKP